MGRVITTPTDLSQYVGEDITIVGSDCCWRVSGPVDPDLTVRDVTITSDACEVYYYDFYPTTPPAAGTVNCSYGFEYEFRWATYVIPDSTDNTFYLSNMAIAKANAIAGGYINGFFVRETAGYAGFPPSPDPYYNAVDVGYSWADSRYRVVFTTDLTGCGLSSLTVPDIVVLETDTSYPVGTLSGTILSQTTNVLSFSWDGTQHVTPYTNRVVAPIAALQETHIGEICFQANSGRSLALTDDDCPSCLSGLGMVMEIFSPSELNDQGEVVERFP